MEIHGSAILWYYMYIESISDVTKQSTYKGEMGEKLDFEGNSKTVLTAVLKMLNIGLQYKTAMTNMFKQTFFS